MIVNVFEFVFGLSIQGIGFLAELVWLLSNLTICVDSGRVVELEILYKFLSTC